MPLKLGSSDASIGGASKLMLGATQIWPASAAWLPTDLSGATTEQIIQQVERCPSGALSYYRLEKGEKE